MAFMSLEGYLMDISLSHMNMVVPRAQVDLQKGLGSLQFIELLITRMGNLSLIVC